MLHIVVRQPTRAYRATPPALDYPTVPAINYPTHNCLWIPPTGNATRGNTCSSSEQLHLLRRYHFSESNVKPVQLQQL